ncbi:hypothetical protein FCULG_00011858 [Fusarium culmorum]|uniref:Uncharacterized protein n=1 Tax=Fusarium culmorum TaxID=5516 RepID=A0A2T4GS08_FUSCU|nr:hypothetical protein FCULG_00011858 [Fusarium culmorum]
MAQSRPTIPGSRLWTIMAYGLHQSRIGHKTRFDPVQLQIQTLLRNDVTAFSAMNDAFSLSRAWAGGYLYWRDNLSAYVPGCTVISAHQPRWHLRLQCGDSQ